MADIYIMKMKDSGGKIYDVYFTEVFYYGYFGDNKGKLSFPGDLDNILVDGNRLRNGITLPINNIWCYDTKGVNACIGAGYTSWRYFDAVGGSGTNRFGSTEGTQGTSYSLYGEFISLTGSTNTISESIPKNAASSTNGTVLLLRDLNGRHALWALSGSNDNEYNRVHVDSLSVPPGEKWGVAGLTLKYSSTGSFSTPVISEDILINKTKQDPFEPGGNSGTGGGQGNFDGTSEPIDFPSMPTLSAADTKFITLYNPTLSQLRDLSSYMWSDLFSLDTLKKIFANPMDCILGLSIVPVNVPDGGARTLTVGNIPTDISMTVAGSQYVDVDCGTLDVKEYWGAYLDYSPYTKFELYLPYIGVRPISADDVMNKTIAIKYRVDILTGACCAFVKCGNSVLYTYVGQCSTSIPITSNDFTSVITGALNIAGAIGVTVASGGMTAPLSAAKAASAGAAIASTAANVASAKPHIEKSGSMSGTGGMMGIQTPYLIVTRPRQCLPQKQNTYTGYPSYITAKLSDLSGYTVVSDIHLEGIPATAEEVSEIDRLLKEGVII